MQGRKIEIIDAPTGRAALAGGFPTRCNGRWSAWAHGAHRARAADGDLQHDVHARVLLRYRFLCGMTGTAAASAAQAFRRLYGLSVCAVPPHRPCIRQDEPDAVFRRAEPGRRAAARQLRAQTRAAGRYWSARAACGNRRRFPRGLSAEGLDYSVLNAREDAREAAVIAQAGAARAHHDFDEHGRARRGYPPRQGGQRAAEQAVRAAGGLLVLGTALNRSRRLDDQLRGRAGRQGDPGGNRFYLAAPEGGDSARALRRQQQRQAERRIRKRATF